MLFINPLQSLAERIQLLKDLTRPQKCDKSNANYTLLNEDQDIMIEMTLDN